MKISKVFLPFLQMLEAVTQLLNSQQKNTPVMVPVRVKENDRATLLSREAERRYNQANNRIL